MIKFDETFWRDIVIAVLSGLILVVIFKKIKI
jgi:hypothetical protein